jgi:filamentous hemagglutinin family protein
VGYKVGEGAATAWLRGGRVAYRYCCALGFWSLFSTAGVLPSGAQPSGPNIAAGQVQITTPSAASTIITQSSQKAVINWQNFSIASGEQVQFSQPNSAAITLDRITGPGASEINGAINANGQVWLINRNGVLFGQGAKINVAGLLATTSDIADGDFLAGSYNFTGTTSATVENGGTIHAAHGGSVVLSASSVSNTGMIEAAAGNVVLGGARAFTIDFAGDHLLSYVVTAPVAGETTDGKGTAQSADVSNSGTIRAPGGKVLMTARAAADVADGVVNNTGLVEATSAHMEDGEVVLDAGNGTASDSGSLNASGKKAGETGGTVQMLGREVAVSDSAKIDVSGDAGGGEVLIGGNFHGAGPEPNAQSTTVGTATINANAIKTGNGGNVAVWSDKDTRFAGRVSAEGGAHSGNGGQVETSGGQLNVANNASVSTLAAKGAPGNWLLDPENIVINTGGTGTVNQSFATTDGVTVAPATIVTALTLGDVTLEANFDITVLADVNVGNSGAGNTLQLRAGHSINGSGSIEYNRGTVVLSAKDPGGSGGLNGPAAITLGGVSAEFIDLQLHSNGVDRGSIGTSASPLKVGSAQIAVQTDGASLFLSASGFGASGALTIGAVGTDVGVNLKGGDPGQVPGNLTLSAGSILQDTGAPIVVTNLTASADANIDLANTNNQVAGAATFQSGSNVSFDNSLATYLGTSSAGGTITAISASDLSLVSGATLTAGAPRNALVLSAGNRFINDAGSSAVQLTGGGRFLIYSENPSDDTFGNLDSHNTAVWDNTYPGAVPISGNRYVFAYQPVISVTSNDISKTYGVDSTGTVAADYTIGGPNGGIANAYIGDAAPTVYSGTPSLTSSGAGAGASVSGGPYAIALTAGSFAVSDNYGLALNAAGHLSVTPAVLVYSADPASRFVGAANPPFSGSVIGFVNGETQSSATSGSLSFSTPAQASSLAGNYPLFGSGLSAPNYVFVQAASNLSALTITDAPPPIVVAASALSAPATTDAPPPIVVATSAPSAPATTDAPPPTLIGFITSTQADVIQLATTIASYQISSIGGVGNQAASNLGSTVGSNSPSSSEPPSSVDLATDFIVTSLNGGPSANGNNSIVIPGLLHAQSGRTRTAATIGDDVLWPAWGNSAMWQ